MRKPVSWTVVQAGQSAKINHLKITAEDGHEGADYDKIFLKQLFANISVMKFQTSSSALQNEQVSSWIYELTRALSRERFSVTSLGVR